MINILGIVISILLIAFSMWLCIKIYRKSIIKNFARELAGLHKALDMFYSESVAITNLAWDQDNQIYELALRLNIVDEMYEEAYKIYDWRKTVEVKD